MNAKKIETRVKDLEKKKEYKDKKPEELQSIAETQLKSVLPALILILQ
ncbi:MAG: hypothetical protein HWD61_03975 [Parachlamydiaceae bacterium]|nr:MAG: hypothetical protein HWD61_03975 [Parachlamydiaceae bacterium]